MFGKVVVKRLGLERLCLGGLLVGSDNAKFRKVISRG